MADPVAQLHEVLEMCSIMAELDCNNIVNIKGSIQLMILVLWKMTAMLMRWQSIWQVILWQMVV